MNGVWSPKACQRKNGVSTTPGNRGGGLVVEHGEVDSIADDETQGVATRDVDTHVIDLFAPYTIGRLRSRNRFVRSATTSGWADEGGIVGPEIVRWYEDLARGGVGLIIKGHLYVDPRGKAHPGMAGISGDEHLPGLARIAEVVHRRGARILAQINHGGYEAEAGERMGPSDFEGPGWRARAMEAYEIGQVIQAFGKAAQRCTNAGFDGVQIHGAHGYLVSQFLSKHANRRSDEWGGELSNRMRLLREIYLEMRTRLGAATVIAVKLNCDDFSEGGFTVEESAQVAHELSLLDIDLIEVSGGGIGEQPRYRERAGSQDAALAEASFGGHCETIRSATRPTSLALVDGLASLEGMQAVVDQDLADLVSLSRPFIREPDLVKKLAAGQHEVTCTRCNGCHDFLGEKMLRCALD
ncbi:MAG TPA: NADH:flavin oxidoreductase [Candidatus Limnocylindrales bacterium]|jgi:2,4-dienoyl-CoA reductase-like NADH-dependent reductase (Old Yellow Enzyme family)